MFELTNEQRKCFALPLVLDSWRKIEIKPGNYDNSVVYAYLDGHRIVKIIMVCDVVGSEMYYEYGVDALLSDDDTQLMPKTAKGKAKKLTTSNIENITRNGMTLLYNRGVVYVVNSSTNQDYYRSNYEGIKIDNLNDLSDWVEKWCSNTDESDLAEIIEFSQRKKVHKKYCEGDFFRFRFNRELYGYGRILVNYDKMRKEGVEFWDVFFGKPLCVAVYHMVTDRNDLTPAELVNYKMLPSQMIMDNCFYYGECEIIGNLPTDSDEDNYTVHYGPSISVLNPHVFHYQSGKTHAIIPEIIGVKADYINNSIGWDLAINLPLVLRCVEEKSNDPYWKMMPQWKVEKDLRNPKHRDLLAKIKRRMRVN